MITNLPIGFRRYTDEKALKAAIWFTFHRGLELAERMGIFALLDEEFEDLDKTIVNINFGYKNNEKIDNMKLINDLCSKTELLLLKDKPNDKL